MSDFLQFVDRIPTLPNRKKITHADSSVEYATIEYADEPVETGTPLNRATLGHIGNIIGYNSMQVTQEEKLNQIVNLIQGEYQRDEQIANVENLGFYNRTSSDYSIFTSADGDKIAIQLHNSWAQRTIEIPSSIKTFKVRTNSTGNNLYLRGSNDKSSWTNYYRLNQNTQYHEINNTYKYYNITNDYNSVTVYLTDFTFDSKINKFTYNEIPNKNNEILKVCVNYDGDASENTLNGKPIDTILLSGHYYELMYDETNDRFIAEEVRT